MAHHKEHLRPLGQVLLEPDDGFHVEVVRRLVQKQEVRLDKECPRQCDAHAPSPREGARRRLLLLLGEAEARQDFRGPRRRRRRVERLQPIVERIQSIRHLVLVLLGWRVLAAAFAFGGVFAAALNAKVPSEHGVEFVDFPFDLGALVVDVEDGFESGVFGWRILLGEMEDVDRFRDGHRARTEDAHERRLARAVFADEAVLVAPVQSELALGDESMAVEGNGEIRHRNILGIPMSLERRRREGRDDPARREVVRSLALGIGP
mmetsp:Transcript_14423/g.47027  ORF Transcript_14423/g.47027 Transcript_14423/m.47027 type:complete len:263 (+) Transcript_14423:1058-1846(+)